VTHLKKWRLSIQQAHPVKLFILRRISHW